MAIPSSRVWLHNLLVQMHNLILFPALHTQWLALSTCQFAPLQHWRRA